MNICVDVGNTTVQVGLFKDNQLINQLSFRTSSCLTQDEFESALKNQIKAKELSFAEKNKVIYSSVVPGIDNEFILALKEVFGVDPIRIGPGIKTNLCIRVDNPSEIGNDLIADLVAAKEIYGAPCLIADLGTASKILTIDKDGCFSYALIMPGIKTSSLNLFEKAALLPSISLKPSKSILAKNTVDAMNEGIVVGHYEMINGLFKRLEEALGYKCKHLISGGGTHHIENLLDDSYVVDYDLALKGLNIILNKQEDK